MGALAPPEDEERPSMKIAHAPSGGARSRKDIGRIRLHRVADVSADSLIPFVQAVIVPGSLVNTDGWRGYSHLAALGYEHRVTVISAGDDPAHVAMPRVHNVASLLKRWLMGTHQGGVQLQHLDDYLDEFTFRLDKAFPIPWPALLSSGSTGSCHRASAISDHRRYAAITSNPSPYVREGDTHFAQIHRISLPEVTIPSSRQNPKILWVDDAKIVRDQIAQFRPVLRDFLA